MGLYKCPTLVMSSMQVCLDMNVYSEVTTLCVQAHTKAEERCLATLVSDVLFSPAFAVSSLGSWVLV